MRFVPLEAWGLKWRLLYTFRSLYTCLLVVRRTPVAAHSPDVGGIDTRADTVWNLYAVYPYALSIPCVLIIPAHRFRVDSKSAYSVCNDYPVCVCLCCRLCVGSGSGGQGDVQCAVARKVSTLSLMFRGGLRDSAGELPYQLGLLALTCTLNSISTFTPASTLTLHMLVMHAPPPMACPMALRLPLHLP